MRNEIKVVDCARSVCADMTPTESLSVLESEDMEQWRIAGFELAKNAYGFKKSGGILEVYGN